MSSSTFQTSDDAMIAITTLEELQAYLSPIALRQRIRKEIMLNPMRLKDYPEYCDDKNIVWMAVINNPLALQFASEALKDDKHLVLMAIGQNPLSIAYASPRLKCDPLIKERMTFIGTLFMEYVCEYRPSDCKDQGD